MKRAFLIFFSLIISYFSFADVAERGIYRTITLPNGNTVKVELRGDEFVHFWEADNGDRYIEKNNQYVLVSDDQIAEMAYKRRSVMLKNGTQRRLANRAVGSFKPMLGHKKGLIILVEFTDIKFSMADPHDYYYRLANEEGFESGRQKGSIRDYFKDQSNGKFILDFDVVGPVKLGQPHDYYGGDADGVHDINAGAMIGQAVVAAGNEVNMADYDWDNDGEVEQIFVVYAGKGQASGGGESTVWPHSAHISYFKYSGYKPMKVDGVEVDTYACSNELKNNEVDGIGTICHEFSHCLGYPDMYDISYNSGATKYNYGMGTWDLMCSGNHNGGGYIPAGYTSWEKMMAGWITPTELVGDMYVNKMKPMSQHGESYIVYNPANHDEYYLFENRKREGWDRALAGEGLLILHTDYDAKVFENNVPNSFREGLNDHQRLTIFHADNNDSEDSENGDPFPYGNVTSFSNTSIPAATLHNRNLDGSYFMNIKVSRISKDEDGYVSFFFGNPSQATSGVGFYESFNDCVGTGANDNNWMSFKVAVGQFSPDNDGWDGPYMKGGCNCGRFGNTASEAYAVTPLFAIDDDMEMTFRAAPFTEEGNMIMELSSDNPDVTLSESRFTLVPGAWTDVKLKLMGKGQTHITFKADCRFYLDEIMVSNPEQLDGIESVRTNGMPFVPSSKWGMYNLNGQRVSKGYRGIFINNGKKIVKGMY